MDTYTLHQTPPDLARELIARTPLVPGDVVLEPFKGEGAFFNSFPSFVKAEWCETTLGKDYTAAETPVDWVITNPPYRLETPTGLKNSLWVLLEYFSTRVRKGVAFLINDKCLSTLTPARLDLLAQRGLHWTGMTVCSVKKWRGRYYYVVFQKDTQPTIAFLRGNF